MVGVPIFPLFLWIAVFRAKCEMNFEQRLQTTKQWQKFDETTTLATIDRPRDIVVMGRPSSPRYRNYPRCRAWQMVPKFTFLAYIGCLSVFWIGRRTIKRDAIFRPDWSSLRDRLSNRLRQLRS